MSQQRNVVVAQSGGPTPVINNSLRGIVEACREYPEIFGKVLGGWHGIEGVLEERLLDLSAQDPMEIALLRTTPAAGSVGTCRYKLKPGQDEDFARVVDVFRAHDVGYFFYIGGNDSMDTAHKVAALARGQGLELCAVGVAKTIDNDVGDADFELIDHTPGYGSVARYWSHIVQNLNEENRGSRPADPVLVAQAMGRRIGYIPAAARLGDPGREMPLIIVMPEAGLAFERLSDRINETVKARGRALVVLSEGFDVGDHGATKDAFGHTQFSASAMTAQQALVNRLNAAGLPARGAARGQTSGTDQRDTMIYASVTDLEEAHRIGQQAVVLAAAGDSGKMATILRRPGLIYAVDYAGVPLEAVANSERTFPKNWIAESGVDVTDDFLRYARPLIGEDWVSVPLVDGRQRFARMEPIFRERKLPDYVPQTRR